ncbi:hypothetical protein JF544_05620 [Halobacillus kuroshimensis]|uniref:XRE family transcriptional regulator n=1 Tax=Halobacillus kuroshimensis TaxID=302481 RepID=A0ABS3DTQ8_9BACI|nr:hypothetical protein [Halobacillus kuroshimensis]MBN8234716.1 hypothetical protein [Halobacillus kuroshimensis]
MSMFLKGKTNKWMVSGEDTEQFSNRAYDLLRVTKGTYSGQVMGQILYQHYDKGLSIKQVNEANRGISYQTVRGVIKGTFSPETFIAYMDLAENEPDQLEKLFGAKEGRQ